MRASPRFVVVVVVVVVVTAGVAPAVAEGQVLSDELIEEVARADRIFVSTSGADSRGCSISDRLLDEEVIRVMRRYRVPAKRVPPPPEINYSLWRRTPVLHVSATAVVADSSGRGCAVYVSTELVAARSWLPAGEEVDLLSSTDEMVDETGSFTQRGRDILRVWLRWDDLTVAKRGVLLVTPRDERDRDVQRAVEDHVSEIAEAISRAR